MRHGAAIDLRDLAGRDATAWATKGDLAWMQPLGPLRWNLALLTELGVVASTPCITVVVLLLVVLLVWVRWHWQYRTIRESRRRAEKKKREAAVGASRCVCYMDRLKRRSRATGVFVQSAPIACRHAVTGLPCLPMPCASTADIFRHVYD